MNAYIDRIVHREGTCYMKAFAKAIGIMKNSAQNSNHTTNCNQVILFLTDGEVICFFQGYQFIRFSRYRTRTHCTHIQVWKCKNLKTEKNCLWKKKSLS